MPPTLVCAGYINIDLVARVPFLPGADGRVTALQIERLIGGMANNVACAAACAGDAWPLDVRLATFIGADADSDWALAQTARLGVNVDWVVRSPDAHTPYCLILVQPTGQRVIVSEPLRFDDEHVLACLQAAHDLSQPRLVHFDGYRLPAMLPLLPRLRALGWQSSIDLDGAPAAWRTPQTWAEAAAAFDVLFVNRNTMAAIWPDLPLGEDGRPARLATLAQHVRGTMGSSAADGAVVVTLGAAGVLLVPRHSVAYYVAAPHVAVVDTTGAGDVFAGLLLAGRLNGVDWAPAAAWATAGASLSTTGRGAQGHLPTAVEIMQGGLPAAVPIA